MSEIQRGRDRIHGAHKDDPQWREWVKLYLDGDKVGGEMSDRVVRGIRLQDERDTILILEHPERMDAEEVVTILFHDGDKVGPFEPWMIGWLKYRWLVKELEEWCDTFEGQLPNGFWFMSNEEVDQLVAAALGSLWMEGDDDG